MLTQKMPTGSTILVMEVGLGCVSMTKMRTLENLKNLLIRETNCLRKRQRVFFIPAMEGECGFAAVVENNEEHP